MQLRSRPKLYSGSERREDIGCLITLQYSKFKIKTKLHKKSSLRRELVEDLDREQLAEGRPNHPWFLYEARARRGETREGGQGCHIYRSIIHQPTTSRERMQKKKGPK